MYHVKIVTSQEEISKIIDLRYEILRKPWNQPKETATDGMEETSVNACIEENGKAIACGRLQNNGEGVGQIRYMAVDEAFQGKGLGKLILKELEKEAEKMGLRKIELQARENALEFYKRNDYSVIQSSFKLWDIIQHYLMVKTIK